VNNDDNDYGGQDESTVMAHEWVLPSVQFQGLWETLIYDDALPQRLLDYVSTAMYFSDCGVNAGLIAWNRVVLLHGPPGTGKTSLCRALSQKLAIRWSHRYAYGKLIEINAHSLFSKWFAESGKLVQKVFQGIWDVAQEDDAFVCILMDEVESLAAARQASMSGSDPQDAVRVRLINALGILHTLI